MGAREEWIEAGRQAVATGTSNVECPENKDGTLQVVWMGVGDGSAGEYRIWCPACGSQNFVLVRNRK